MISPALAQDPVTAFAEQGAVIETLDDTAQITGGVVVGFYAVADKSADPLPAADVEIPATWSDAPVCSRLVSNDGLYERRQDLKVASSWPGGRAPLPMATQHGDLLAEADESRIAPLLQKGTCSDKVQEIAAVSWNKAYPEEPASFVLLVNSRRANMVSLVVGTGAELVDCEEVTAANRMAFDFRCSIPAERIAAGKPTRIEIKRQRNGTFDRSVVVHVTR